MDYQHLLADRTNLMQANAIREILKVVSNPGIISLAGGIPSPESFPMDIIQELTNKVLKKYKSTAFQYDLTEGFFFPLNFLTILSNNTFFVSTILPE